MAYSADIFISPQSLLVIKYFGEAVLPPRLLCLEATAPLPPSHATAARLREFPRRHEAVLLAVYTCRNADVWGVRTDNVYLHKQASRTTLDTLPRPHPLSLSLRLSVLSAWHTLLERSYSRSRIQCSREAVFPTETLKSRFDLNLWCIWSRVSVSVSRRNVWTRVSTP